MRRQRSTRAFARNGRPDPYHRLPHWSLVTSARTMLFIRVSPGHHPCLHGIGLARLSVTNGILRIGSRQVSTTCATSIRAASTVGEHGVVRDSLPRLLGRVAEWQTRWLQVPVSFGTWGFKSPFAHNFVQANSNGVRANARADAEGLRRARRAAP